MQGQRPRAALQLNFKYVCFKRRAGHVPAIIHKKRKKLKN